MKNKILLVEDEASLAHNLKLNLELEGFSVNAVGDGSSAIRAFGEEKYDMVILDIMIPNIDGITVCENIRLKDNQTPILFLSAKNTVEDRVLGLKKGGDDYIVKPFNLEELILRVDKLISRNKVQAGDAKPGINEYSFSDNYVNFISYDAKGQQGEFKLTKKEALLLKLLIENKDEVVSREKIFQTVWGYSVYPSTRTIDNFVLAFRKYFEIDQKNPKHFHSLRGVGYKFTD
jgi:two-component system, OmpR family, alkaline phosphatase synthesis response regulator PhoP